MFKPLPKINPGPQTSNSFVIADTAEDGVCGEVIPTSV